jgi:CheY-specific phosphatase CheX
MSTAFNRENIVRELRKATAEIFATMLGIDVSTGEAFAESQGNGNSGVMSFIGLGGNGVGTGGLCCSSETACQLASTFLLTPFESVDEEVLDVFGELTNMILGGLKTHLEGSVGPMTLGIPTVVHGQQFTARSLSHEEWTVVPFSWPSGRLEVRIYLKPASEARTPLVHGVKTEFYLAG